MPKSYLNKFIVYSFIIWSVFFLVSCAVLLTSHIYNYKTLISSDEHNIYISYGEMLYTICFIIAGFLFVVCIFAYKYLKKNILLLGISTLILSALPFLAAVCSVIMLTIAALFNPHYGLIKNDISDCETVKLNSVNITLNLPKGIQIEENSTNDTSTDIPFSWASFDIHKYKPGGLSEEGSVISFYIVKYERRHWNLHSHIINHGTRTTMPSPDDPDLILNREITRTDYNTIEYKKDIISQSGDVIRINCHINKVLS